MKIPIVWLPKPLTLRNFVEAWNTSFFPHSILNSVQVTLLTLVGDVLTCSFVAYGFAKRRFPGREKLFLLVLATMMIPFNVRVVPLYLLFHKFGWINTLKPLWVPKLFGDNALYIFLFRQFFRAIPDELDEAAEIDGCNPVRTYWTITMRLSGPVIATVGIFSFMFTWNDLWGPLIFINTQSHYTLALSLQQFVSDFGIEYNLLMAAATISLIPCLAVFFILQRQFVRGVALTGIKT